MTTSAPAPDFQTTIRDMWAARPPRIPKKQGGNAKIAGVCEGIGARYQIDPTLVRIFFVVGAFVGSGIAVYLLAWLIMPRYSLPLSPLEAISKPEGKQFPKERQLGWWLLIGNIICWLSSGSDPQILTSSNVVFLAISFGCWYLLHKRMPLPPAGLIPASATVPGPDFSGLDPVEGFDSPYSQQTPPSWDPLGAAPFAWHLPEPGEAPQPKPKTSFGGWILRVALVFGGIALVAGSIFAASFDNNPGPSTGVGKATVAVEREADLGANYDFGVGETTFDLSGLEALSNEHTVEIQHGVGKLKVLLPTTTPVRVECSTGIGDQQCPTEIRNADADGARLTLKIHNGVGEIKVS